MNRRTGAPLLLAASAIVGAAGGWWLARRHDRMHREDLYSPKAYRRFAALGWLASEADADQVPVLLDYIAWEPEVALRERAQRVVAKLRASEA